MLRDEQIELIVSGIVEELLEKDIIEKDNAFHCADILETVMKKEKELVEELNQEANELMKEYSDKMWQEGVNQRVMFQKIRQKLAKERDIVI